LVEKRLGDLYGNSLAPAPFGDIAALDGAFGTGGLLFEISFDF